MDTVVSSASMAFHAASKMDAAAEDLERRALELGLRITKDACEPRRWQIETKRNGAFKARICGLDRRTAERMVRDAIWAKERKSE